MKKGRRKVRNALIRLSGYVAGFLLVLNMSAVDSESIVPSVMTVVCGGYLYLLGVANSNDF